MGYLVGSLLALAVSLKRKRPPRSQGGRILARASSYYLSAMLAAPMGRELGVSTRRGLL